MHCDYWPVKKKQKKIKSDRMRMTDLEGQARLAIDLFKR